MLSNDIAALVGALHSSGRGCLRRKDSQVYCDRAVGVWRYCAEGDIIVLQDIFVLEMKGKTPDGRILTEMKPTGTRPRFTSRLEAHGFKLPASVFGADVGTQRKPW